MALKQQTMGRLRELKLSGMASAYQHQDDQPTVHEMGFDERLGLMVEHEWGERENRKLKRLLRCAALPERASIEDIDYRASRGLDKPHIATLASCGWIRKNQHLVIVGPTGGGKTWLGCAFASQVCRLGMSALFYKAAELFSDIGQAALDGSLPKLKVQLTKPRLLIVDDLGIGEMSSQVAHVLLEIVDRRSRSGSLLITSQYPTEKWHGFFPDPTIADAVLDRVVHKAHRITVKGESMRKHQARKEMENDQA